MKPMKQVYHTYLEIIKEICTDSADNSVRILPEDFSALTELAKKQCTIPFLLPYLRNTPYYPFLKQQTKNALLHYYELEHFTRKTVSLLEEHHITCCLLKGLSLADCYPIPEYRKSGDLDLYIYHPHDLKRAKSLLISHGYVIQEEVSDHHLLFHYTFQKTGRQFDLELHYRIVGLYQYEKANQIVDEVFSAPSTVVQTVYGYSYCVLAPTECVFYMIHHMLKHYLYSGFGIRLLCDFTLYLKRFHKEVDFEKIHSWCKESKIFHLYEIILSCCHNYIGLSASIDSEIHYNITDCEKFLSLILDGGDMGADVSRSLAGTNSYQKITLFTYLKEGHLQMKVRFPNACHFPLLWPFLWSWTFFCFLRNNKVVRKTTFRQTLNDFKNKNKATQIIHIFENSDS